MTVIGEHPRSGNFILDSLPSEEYELLQAHLKQVTLKQGEVLVRLREKIARVYFPTTATVSWLISTLDGDTVDIGMTGFEGIVGTTLLLNQDRAPWEVRVQLTGEAVQIDVQSFIKALPQSPTLQQKMGAFTYQKIMQLSQSALCNRFHAVEQRLCRWLLAAQDRARTSELLLTRDVLAQMIGSTRPAVSIVTGTLQAAGLIRAERGKVTILNREEMEEATCECYHLLKQTFDLYLQN